jgi:MFS family permease
MDVDAGLKHNYRLFALTEVFLSLRPLSAITVVYFVHVTGSYASAMSLLSITALSAAILEVPTGVLSDWFGRKQTLIAGCLSVIGALVLYALAPGFEWLAVGSLFEGLAASFFSGNNEALLYESLPETDREERYPQQHGRIGTMTATAAAIAAFSSGIIASVAFAYVAWTSAFFASLAFLTALFLHDPGLRSERSETNLFAHLWAAIKQFSTNARLRDLSITSTMDWGIGGSMNTFQPAFVALLWPTWAIGFAKVFEDLSYAGSSWFSGHFVKRWGGEKILLWGASLKSAIGFVAYGFPTAISPALLAIEESVTAPMHISQDNLMQREFTEEQRATMASLNALAGNLSYSVCAILLGYAADQLGAPHTLLLGEVVLLPILFFYYRITKQIRFMSAT